MSDSEPRYNSGRVQQPRAETWAEVMRKRRHKPRNHRCLDCGSGVSGPRWVRCRKCAYKYRPTDETGTFRKFEPGSPYPKTKTE